MRSSDRILPDFLKKNIAFSKSGRGIRFFYNTQEGMVIANISGAINRIDETKYVVKSQNGNGDYDVCSTELGWVCSCPDHKFRGVKCRPIFAVEISFALRKQVEVARIPPTDSLTNLLLAQSV